MKTSHLPRRAFSILFFPAVFLSLALYYYPYLLGCSFHSPSPSQPVAPFRLLALGDPQLEGDSSLPNPTDPLFPSIRAFLNHDLSDFSNGFLTERPTLVNSLKDLVNNDLPRVLYIFRKRLDLFGNDYYLAHIYRTLHKALKPTHVTVLGDLIGSQWISDEEFDRRGWRYWNRVFAGGSRVADASTQREREHIDQDKSWSRRIINVAGNHDIGYAGDINQERVQRFERMYGKVNWDMTFSLPTNTSRHTSPELRLVILNDMNLDNPAYDRGLQTETYAFLNNRVIGNARPVEDKTAAIVLLTHIPLRKEEGVCVDGPLFEYGPYGLREQNHLSYDSTIPVLEGIFGLNANTSAPERGAGRSGVILTGHDHEGCDVYHYVSESPTESGHKWSARRWAEAQTLIRDPNVAGVREITVRSMMGSYGGNAGLLSAWFDEQAGEWRFEYDTCALGVQHIWWAVHVLDFVTLACFVLSVVIQLLSLITRADSLSEIRRDLPNKAQASNSSYSPLAAIPNGSASATGLEVAGSEMASRRRRG